MTEVEKRLLLILAELEDSEQRSLLDFAEYLAQRGNRVAGLLSGPAAQTLSPTTPAQPNLLPRPASETVVAAIKRLRLSYPMLDRRVLLNDTANAMSKHALGGEKAQAVIDELEAIFEQHYQQFRDKFYKASDA